MSEKEVTQDSFLNTAQSPFYRSPEEHQRIPFRDAVRNGLVLAGGIFGPLNPAKVMGNPVDGKPVNLTSLTASEIAARRMMVGYLCEQLHPKLLIALEVNLKVDDLSQWGWDDRDWLVTAQEEAAQIAAEKAKVVSADCSRSESLAEGRRQAMSRILDIILENPTSVDLRGSVNYEISRETVLGHKRFKGLVELRTLFTLLSRSLMDVSLKDVGGFLGGRDHSTIINLEKRGERIFNEDPEARSMFLAKKEEVGQRLKEEGLI